MKIILIGAGNHCKVVIDILQEQGRENDIAGILDDNEDYHGKELLGIEVLGSLDKINDYRPDQFEVLITIGNVQVRKKIYERLIKENYKFTNAIHPDCQISSHARIGDGAVINSGVRIHPDAVLEENILLGLNVTISHDAYLECHSHLSPGVHIAGEVKLEECVDIGLGAVVIPRIIIGNNSIIGAGAAVLKDVESNSVNVGIPSKKIKENL